MFKPPYDDQIKTAALGLLASAGYPSRRDALSAVSRATGVSVTTLRRWALARRDELLSLAHPAGAGPLTPDSGGMLPDAIRAELLATLRSMAEARPGASYKELSGGFSVLAEKLKMLDLPDREPGDIQGEAKEKLAALVGLGLNDVQA